ncbi:MAG TPA: hypothetical protein VI078_01495 [bacterium]
MSEPQKFPEEVMEDWEAILLRPGMSVLATFMSGELDYALARMDADEEMGLEKLSVCRGEIKALRRVIRFVKKEFNRAAKSDTPETKEQ